MINRSKLKKKAHKLLIKTKISIDYTGGAFFLILAIVVYVAATPWILKKRKIWQNTAQSNNKALIIHTLTLGKVQERGYEYLLPFRDTAALADKMDYVAKHPDVAKKIGLQGRDFARIVFDKEKILQKESMYYKQVLQR